MWEFFQKHPRARKTAGEQPRPVQSAWITRPVVAPRVEFRTFESAAAKARVSFHLYTPEAYDTEKERRFPVLYWLHGTGGGLAGIAPLAEWFDAAIRDGKMPPMLVVFPNGLATSMWCDSKDGSVPMETVVVKELVPHVDATLRTIARSKGRIIEGFSMGGYGAARLGFKYPELFGAVSILAGGPLDLEFQGPRTKANPAERETILRTTFGSDLDYYRAQSPVTLAEQNAAAVRSRVLVRQAVGSRDFTIALNLNYSALLRRLEIPHTFTEVPDVAHDTLALLRGIGEANWEFYRAALGSLSQASEALSAGSPPSKSAPPATGAGMKVLRTPDARFANLPGYPFEPHYLFVDDGAGGKLRMHYLDEGPNGATTILLLHGNPTWTYLFREVIPLLNAAGYRKIALDYIGMGRSDKPAGYDDYSYDRHLDWIRQAFAQLDKELGLGRVNIFGHDYGVPFGIRLMAEHYPDRFDSFINANASLPVGSHIAPTHLKWRQFVRDNPDVPVGNVISSRITPPLTRAEILAWNAPYPDASYKMAIRSFPEMVPDSPQRPEAVANLAAWRYLEKFQKPFMTIFGGFDAVSLPSARRDFIQRVPGAYGQPHPQLDVTHYAPEDKPADVAREVIQFLAEVYHPTPFTTMLRTTFEKQIDGFVPVGGLCRWDAEKQALQITSGPGEAASAQQTKPMDLTRSDALKVSFRYLPSGFNDGGSFVVELWDGSRWTEMLRQTAGKDFRKGAEDYAFARLDPRQTKFSADARIRIRVEAADTAANLSVLDLGIETRMNPATP